MRIAISGKGGSGKTTVAGLLARHYARAGRRVLAIDGDSNPNLGVALGMPAERAAAIAPLPHDVMTTVTDQLGNRRQQLSAPVSTIAADHGVDAPDGVRLLVASRIDHAGTG